MAKLTLTLQAVVQSDDDMIHVFAGNLDAFAYRFASPSELSDWLETSLGERGLDEAIRERFVDEASTLIGVVERFERVVSSLTRERDDVLQRLSAAAN